jgi:zinc protease
MPALRLAIAFALSLIIWIAPAQAIDIREVKSTGGITAWLVQDSTNPLIAMQFSFAGGSTNDPEGKEGTAHFLTSMMDEGAGNLDSTVFQARRDELAMKMSFDTSLDNFTGSFQTLTDRRDESFALLKLALTVPRFDVPAFERMRDQLIIGARQNEEEPDNIAANAWMKIGFPPGHPYARPSEGTPASIAAITPSDLRDIHKKLFTRRGLKVAVVGDIDEATLARLLDETFSALPDTEPPSAPPLVHISEQASTTIVDRDIPQSVIVFGHEGILRDDPQFIPAFVMSFILGGGGFGSRLMEEVREKRGLTYGVSSGLYPFERAGLLWGSLSTRNEKAGEALAILKDTMKRFADEGPTEQELADVKTYLTGSYALRFDSNSKIANQLLGIQEQNLGIDYVNKRNAMIDAVTLEQVKAEAKRLTRPENLVVTIVGRPQGIQTSAN